MDSGDKEGEKGEKGEKHARTHTCTAGASCSRFTILAVMLVLVRGAELL